MEYYSSDSENDNDNDVEMMNNNYHKTLVGFSILLKGICVHVRTNLEDLHRRFIEIITNCKNCNKTTVCDSCERRAKDFLVKQNRNNKEDVFNISILECFNVIWKFIFVFLDPVSEEFCDDFDNLSCSGHVYLLINVLDFENYLTPESSLDPLRKVHVLCQSRSN